MPDSLPLQTGPNQGQSPALSDPLAAALARQEALWQQGQRVLVEELASSQPEWQSADFLLELI